VKLLCAFFAPQDDSSPTASGAKWAGSSPAAPCLYVRISHAALPYIIMQLLELLQMSDKTEFYFNSSLVKAFLSDAHVNVPAAASLHSSQDDDDAALPPPPSKRRIMAVQAQLECSAAIAEKVLRLADLRHRNLQTFTTSVMRELGLQALLDDVKSRDPELKTKRAKKISKINDLQRMVFQQLDSVDSILPLLQGRTAGVAYSACHVIFKYDCWLDLPKGGGVAWQGLTFDIAFSTPQSTSNPKSVPVWGEVGGGGVYDVTQQSTLTSRDAGKVCLFRAAFQPFVATITVSHCDQVAQSESKRGSHGGAGGGEHEVHRTSTLCGFSLHVR
jgi:hypothetical protein